jgi:hypothetical protein
MCYQAWVQSCLARLSGYYSWCNYHCCVRAIWYYKHFDLNHIHDDYPQTLSWRQATVHRSFLNGRAENTDCFDPARYLPQLDAVIAGIFVATVVMLILTRRVALRSYFTPSYFKADFAAEIQGIHWSTDWRAFCCAKCWAHRSAFCRVMWATIWQAFYRAKCRLTIWRAFLLSWQLVIHRSTIWRAFCRLKWWPASQSTGEPCVVSSLFCF